MKLDQLALVIVVFAVVFLVGGFILRIAGKLLVFGLLVLLAMVVLRELGIGPFKKDD